MIFYKVPNHHRQCKTLLDHRLIICLLKVHRLYFHHSPHFQIIHRFRYLLLLILLLNKTIYYFNLSVLYFSFMLFRRILSHSITTLMFLHVLWISTSVVSLFSFLLHTMTHFWFYYYLIMVMAQQYLDFL